MEFSLNNHCAALFYRKRLIALPITDNATINDLGWREGGPKRSTESKRGVCVCVAATAMMMMMLV